MVRGCLTPQHGHLALTHPRLQGLLTGKYFSPGGAPPRARLNLYRGRYAEAEGRYPLDKCVQPRLWPCMFKRNS